MGWGWGRWVKACDGCFEGDYARVWGPGGLVRSTGV